MNANNLTRGIVQAFLIIVGLITLFNLVMMAQSLLGYVFLAIVVSLVGQPIKGFLTRILKFKNTLATVVTLQMAIMAIVTNVKVARIANEWLRWRIGNMANHGK